MATARQEAADRRNGKMAHGKRRTTRAASHKKRRSTRRATKR